MLQAAPKIRILSASKAYQQKHSWSRFFADHEMMEFKRATLYGIHKSTHIMRTCSNASVAILSSPTPSFLFHARCAVYRPLAGIWVGRTQNRGSAPTFSPIFLLNCSQWLSAPVCFHGLAWPLPTFLASSQHVLFGRSRLFCPDLPIEPGLNWGRQHLPRQQPAGHHLTCNPSERE